MGEMGTAWMDHLGLVAVRANSDWVVIRRRCYFDAFLEDDEGPFVSVEVLLNDSQDKLLVRVWGRTWYTSDKSELPEICKEVFSKRPCLGIWHHSCHPTLTDDALSRLTFTDTPVVRYKAMDCEEWVGGGGDEESPPSSSEMHYPAMCVKCKDISRTSWTRASGRKRKVNSRYEEEEVVKVKEELSPTTSELDFVDFNAGKLDSEGGEEEDLLDDAAGTEMKQDEVCEDAFDECEDKFFPDKIDEVPPEPKVEMWEVGGDLVDGRLTPVHLHECPQCHSQLGTTRSLWAHKTKPRQCLVGGFCKQDHSHSFVVKKYSSRDDALEHAKTLEGKWGMKHDTERVVAKQCRVGFCSAKWKVKTWTRKDEAETVDYVLMACLTHDHSKEKEANEAKKKRDTIRMEKLKEEDPERYAEMTRKAPEKQRERQRRKYKIKFDEPQPCPHCAKMFEFKYAMARHMKRHVDENKYKCEKCDYGSYDKNSFKNHKANHLVEEGLAERAHCPECGKGFNSEFYLRNHMDNVHPVDGTKYYRCPMCDLVFKQPNARKLHVERDHKGSAHPCDRCDKVFHIRSHLLKHVRVSHRTAEEKDAARLKCDICNRMLSCKLTYNNHMKIHSGSRDVRCTFCAETFYTQLLMSQHRKKAHAKQWEAQKKEIGSARVFRLAEPKRQRV